MLYLVLNITNYDKGYVCGGYYKSYERAKKRLEYCESKMNEDGCDSWRIIKIDSPNITGQIDDYSDEMFK